MSSYTRDIMQSALPTLTLTILNMRDQPLQRLITAVNMHYHELIFLCESRCLDVEINKGE